LQTTFLLEKWQWSWFGCMGINFSYKGICVCIKHLYGFWGKQVNTQEQQEEGEFSLRSNLAVKGAC